MTQGSPSTPAERQAHLWFDPQKRAAGAPLKARIAALVKHLEAREADLTLRQRQRKDADQKAFHLAVEALAANFFFIMKAGTGHAMAIPRDHNRLQARSRYRPEVYGQGLVLALDLLAHPAVALVENVQGGFKVGSRSQPSLFRPLPALGEWLPVAEMPWDSIASLEPREVLVLKAAKDAEGEAGALDYKNTDRLRTLRNEVRRINRHLQKAPIFLESPPGQALVDHEGRPVDPTRRSLRRIFNNASWYDGGRLFGGFWESMPRAQRFEHLRLGSTRHPEGEPVANVDFKQLFPRLAYHRAGVEPPEGDLYAITASDDPNREGWKPLLNAMLCAKRRLRTWPRGVHEAFAVPMPLREALEAVERKHAPIMPLFWTGIGLRFMLQESTALLYALRWLFGRGIPALPLHDSVLVPRSEAETAKAALIAGMEWALSWSRAEVSIDFGE